MEKLKAEIARKKAEAEALRTKTTSQTKGETNDATTLSSSAVKFIRQKDVLAAKQRQLEEQQRQVDLERERRIARERETEIATSTAQSCVSVTRKRESDEKERDGDAVESKRRRESEPAVPAATTIGESPAAAQSREELERLPRFQSLRGLSVQDAKQRLRALGEPVSLFAETESERLQRLVCVSIDYELRRSEYKDREEMRQMKLRDERDEKALEDADDAPADKTRAAESDSDGERVRNVDKQVLRYDPAVKFSQMKDLSLEEQVYKFFRTLLKEWEHDLNARSEAEKNSAKGKKALQAQKGCKDYIRPLFKLCRRREVPFDILHKLQLMVKHCEDGDFVQANDEYIRTAIGNAAWPIGLTMVGIHERSGRERISTSKIAHVMNNEQERKYLTSVKQLMTFAQSKRPDVPPSKKVLV